MEFQFMTADTLVPPFVPLPAVLVGYPVSSTAKVLYARLLGEVLERGIEDENGVLFIRFPLIRLAAVLSRSMMTAKRVLRELEESGMILRVRGRFGEISRIYVLLPKDWSPTGGERLENVKTEDRHHGIHAVKLDRVS